jgi:hypothetical protein
VAPGRRDGQPRNDGHAYSPLKVIPLYCIYIIVFTSLHHDSGKGYQGDCQTYDCNALSRSCDLVLARPQASLLLSFFPPYPIAIMIATPAETPVVATGGKAPVNVEPTVPDHVDGHEDEDDGNEDEDDALGSGVLGGEGAKKKKKKKKPKKKKVEQTDPPGLGLSKLFPSGVYPLGEVHEYKDE